MRDYQKDWDDIWEPILINRDGTLDEEQIKKELSDMLMLMDSLTKIYYVLSNGQVSNPLTEPQVVIQMVEERLLNAHDEGYALGVKHAQSASLADSPDIGAWEDDGGNMRHNRH